MKKRIQVKSWSVQVYFEGQQLVSLGADCLSGKPEFTEEEAKIIREAGESLLAFIGRRASKV